MWGGLLSSPSRALCRAGDARGGALSAAVLPTLHDVAADLPPKQTHTPLKGQLEDGGESSAAGLGAEVMLGDAPMMLGWAMGAGAPHSVGRLSPHQWGQGSGSCGDCPCHAHW